MYECVEVCIYTCKWSCLFTPKELKSKSYLDICVRKTAEGFGILNTQLLLITELHRPMK